MIIGSLFVCPAAWNSLVGVDRSDMSRSLALDDRGELWLDIEPGEERNDSRSCVL